MGQSPEIGMREIVREFLEKEQPRGISFWKEVPNSTDREFHELMKACGRFGPKEWSDARKVVSSKQGAFLTTMASRMITWSEKAGDEEVMYSSILAHVLEDFRTDERENLVRLSGLRGVADSFGIDLGPLLEKATALATTETARKLRERA